MLHMGKKLELSPFGLIMRGETQLWFVVYTFLRLFEIKVSGKSPQGTGGIAVNVVPFQLSDGVCAWVE